MAVIHTKCGTPITVDDRDYDWLKETTWYLSKGRRSDKKYAFSSTPVTYMHRLIVERHGGIPKDMVVHHINDDCFDNRLENLAVVTQSHNIQMGRKARGGSPYLGVGPYRGKWNAFSSKDDRKVHLGYFDNEIEAAKAYDSYVIDRYGPTAKTNFPIA